MAGHHPWSAIRRRKSRSVGANEQDLFAEVLVAYARNLLVGTNVVDRLQRGSGRKPEDYALLARAVSPKRRPHTASRFVGKEFREHLAVLRRRTRGELEEASAPSDPAGANLALIAAVIGLGPAEREVLQFMATQRLCSELEDITDAFAELSRAACTELVAV